PVTRRRVVSLAGATRTTGRARGGIGRQRRSPTDAERAKSYLPAARRWKRGRFSIFLCFFFRMGLRRFLMRGTMASGNLAGALGRCETRGHRRGRLGGRDSNPEVEDQNLACCRLHHPRWVPRAYRAGVRGSVSDRRGSPTDRDVLEASLPVPMGSPCPWA